MRKVTLDTTTVDEQLTVTSFKLNVWSLIKIDVLSREGLIRQINIYKHKYLPRVFNLYMTTKKELDTVDFSYKTINSEKYYTFLHKLQKYRAAYEDFDRYNKEYIYMRFKLENPDIKTYKDIPRE